MKVSLNTVKKYTEVDLPVDDLVAKINRQLGGVEEVIDLGEKYRNTTIVRVTEVEKHPNADRLSICKIDAGIGELVQVVCGAPNVHAEMWAVWLPSDSIVPGTYHDEEPFVLGVRELRGVVSNGMLASAKELALGEDHEGIIEVTDNDLPPDSTLQLEPGQSFAEVFGLNDTIINIENKMFTHRPDLFGQLGVAREISAILQGSSDESLSDEDTNFVNPDWYWNMPEFDSGNGSLELDIFNDNPEGSPRFMAVAIDGVSVGPSPLWLRCELVRWGSKPINNIVDWTNYIMLLTAQPTHAYDYDRLRGHKLGVRMARDGERVTLLNGKQYSLTVDDIVIADGEGAVGLAGIMGGGNSEVTPNTTRIVLEVANFNMYAVRKSSMRYGLFTDALTRFNKGQSPLQCGHIVQRLLELIPGEQASSVYDLPDTGGQLDKISVHGEVPVSVEFINQRLGLDMTEEQVGSLLRRVNIAVHPSENHDNKLSVTAPYWRTDIELPEDIVEEVGRLYGFDKLPRELPLRSTRPTSANSAVVAKQKIRDSLMRAGANEVLTYSFVHQQILEQSNQDPSQAFKLSNALSPDLQYYRLSMTPSLLDRVHANIKAGFDEFAMFEIGKAHNSNDFDDEGLPRQYGRVGLVYANRKSTESSAYYKARKIAMSLYVDSHLADQVSFTKLEDFDFTGFGMLEQMCAPYDGERSAMLYVGKQFVGVVGEYKTGVIQKFKLPKNTSGFELFLSPFKDTKIASYVPLHKFPSTHQDISLRVEASVNYADIYDGVKQVLADAASHMKIELEPQSIYQAVNDGDKKTISLRVTANHPERTLTDTEMTQLMDTVANSLADSVGAIRI